MPSEPISECLHNGFLGFAANFCLGPFIILHSYLPPLVSELRPENRTPGAPSIVLEI